VTEDRPARRADAALLHAPLGELLDDLAGDARVPGAGSVAALCVAMSASVVAMAGRVSSDGWEHAGAAVAQADALRRRVTPLAAADAEVLRDAVALLDGTAQGEGGDRELGAALDRAADVPLAIAEAAADVAHLASWVAGEGAPSVRADAVAAALLAHGAARAAAHLVEVNLLTTGDDLRLLSARSLAARAGTWADAALALER
jgi:methenyltetrahydrofolate cyclohydrolase